MRIEWLPEPRSQGAWCTQGMMARTQQADRRKASRQLLSRLARTAQTRARASDPPRGTRRAQSAFDRARGSPRRGSVDITTNSGGGCTDKDGLLFGGLEIEDSSGGVSATVAGRQSPRRRKKKARCEAQLPHQINSDNSAMASALPTGSMVPLLIPSPSRSPSQSQRLNPSQSQHQSQLQTQCHWVCPRCNR